MGKVTFSAMCKKWMKTRSRMMKELAACTSRYNPSRASFSELILAPNINATYLGDMHTKALVEITPVQELQDELEDIPVLNDE